MSSRPKGEILEGHALSWPHVFFEWTRRSASLQNFAMTGTKVWGFKSRCSAAERSA